MREVGHGAEGAGSGVGTRSFGKWGREQKRREVGQGAEVSGSGAGTEGSHSPGVGQGEEGVHSLSARGQVFSSGFGRISCDTFVSLVTDYYF